MKVVILIFLSTISLFAQNNLKRTWIELNIPAGIAFATEVNHSEHPYLFSKPTFAIMPSFYVNHELGKKRNWILRWSIGLMHISNYLYFSIPRADFSPLVNINEIPLDPNGFYTTNFIPNGNYANWDMKYEIGLSRRFLLKNNWQLIANTSFILGPFGVDIGNIEDKYRKIKLTNGSEVDLVTMKVIDGFDFGDIYNRTSLFFQKKLSDKVGIQLGMSVFIPFSETAGAEYQFNYVKDNDQKFLFHRSTHLELNVGLCYYFRKKD